MTTVPCCEEDGVRKSKCDSNLNLCPRGREHKAAYELYEAPQRQSKFSDSTRVPATNIAMLVKDRPSRDHNSGTSRYETLRPGPTRQLFHWKAMSTRPGYHSDLKKPTLVTAAVPSATRVIVVQHDASNPAESRSSSLQIATV